MGYKVSIWLQALTVQGSLWEKIPFFCAFKEHFFSLFLCHLLMQFFSLLTPRLCVCFIKQNLYCPKSEKYRNKEFFFLHWDSNAYSMFEVCILTTYVLQPLWWSIPYISWYPPRGPWKLAITLFYDTLWR